MKLKIALYALLFVALSCDKENDTNNPVLNPANNKAVGASANDLLSAAKYNSLKVEIQYMPGFAPDAAAITHLQNFLSTYLNKPNGITIVTKEIASTNDVTLSVDEIQTIEKTNRTAFSTNNEIAVYILYTNGNYTENNVLGVAHRNTSAALFGKKIHENSGGLAQVSRTKLEATVLEHEVAHLLGLVDIGTPMQTAHKANGNHCNNQNCLMHFASETTDILGFLLTGNIPPLDNNCINDLKANGGK